MKYGSIITLVTLCAVAETSAQYEVRNFTLPTSTSSGYHSRFTVDISHPGMEYLTLPLGSAHVKGLAMSSQGDVYGITNSSREDAAPAVFRFDVELQQLAAFATLADLGLEKQTLSRNITHVRPFTGTYGDGETGQLIEVVSEGGKLALKSLKTIREGHGIYTLAISADGEHLFGTLYPTNAFFHYRVATGEVRIFEETALSERLLELGRHHHDPEQLLCKALGLDGRGRVYGSTANGEIFRYDPVSRQVQLTNAFVPGHSYRRTVSSWALAGNGKLYGGTSLGGRLFELDPETLAVKDLGKPVREEHLRSLIAVEDVLYGVVGELPEESHLFAYDISSHSFSGVAGEALGSRSLRYWMLPMNSTARPAGPISHILDLKNGSALIAECDLLASLLFIRLQE